MDGSKEQVELLMMYEEIKKERNNYKKQRDSLIKDVEKLREDSDRYEYLTNYIKNKALHNPSVNRYIDMVHFIDDLEREQYE